MLYYIGETACPFYLQEDQSQSRDDTPTDEPITLSQKLLPFFNNTNLSDVTLSVGPYVFHAHKLILCSWSDVFGKMLNSPTWTETHANQVCTLNEAQECVGVFRDFLQFMYTETLELSKETAYPLHKLARKYKVDELCDLCEEFLVSEVKDGLEALKMLNEAEQCGVTKLYEHCFKMLETYFEFLPDESLVEMRPSLFLKLLDSSNLVVSSEFTVVAKALRWLTYDRRENYKKYTENVISKLRLAHIAPSTLKLMGSQIPHYPWIYPRFKKLFLKRLHEVFEWITIAPEDEFSLLPCHIQFTSFSRNSANFRYYIGEPDEGYQLLFEDTRLPVEVFGISANNFHENDVCWFIKGATFCDEVSKKWGFRYNFEPWVTHKGKHFRLVILTVVSNSDTSNPIVHTTEGNVAGALSSVQDVTVTLQPEITGLKVKPTNVKVKVIVYVKLKHTDILKCKLYTPADIAKRKMSAPHTFRVPHPENTAKLGLYSGDLFFPYAKLPVHM